MKQIFISFTEQDSGNLSYGVEDENGKRYFVKTAGRREDNRPYLSYEGRVELLRNATHLHSECQHPILIPLLECIEVTTESEEDGELQLIYPWVEGELLGVPRERRTDPTSAYCRFRALPAATITHHLTEIYDLHALLESKGWVASDFYDGCLLYDFEAGKLAVMDLDTYHKGAFQNTMGRMFGSTRFMAPEEFELDATIDSRTTVFTMGRTALEFLSDGTLNAERFRGTPAQHALIVRACHPTPTDRFPTMQDFYNEWQIALLEHKDR